MGALPSYCASRYVQPLREGGSLPAVVDTEGGLFVVKFRGAGQGTKVLVAELIVGGLALRLGLPTPELALVEISSRFGRSEPDPEIQDLLRKSHGVNVGNRYLDGAFNFDLSAAGSLVPSDLAARIVWLDAFTTNPDRTARNPNLLVWQRQPWLIDHGAALYAHHDWASVDGERTRTPFPLIRSHVLLRQSGDLTVADRECAARLTDDAIRDVVSSVPDSLLVDPAGGANDFASGDEARDRYLRYLTERLAEPREFLREAIAAQEQVRLEPPLHLKARR
ncbi:MAG: aminotransferase class I and II [Gemmatimonadaceae bacterium]|nr:aminotransferase class I and II [Gemmatimonadaceae bacterium]NUO93485.1 aminotransferase class I and II [Gemmatimonadaceae bacterium]NUP55443.1 aminotransferase class I and II [Gemmatimonadaceae bacterium]NUP70787.1 aminotransferase class I and II [Gemmatimonadaceae bacterium]NUR35776.1 aminotransferase class I and II [Gemmatimonadaceae bacterium]